MSHPMVTFADAVAAIGTLPSLSPRPCATNIRALATDLINKLAIIPSEQTADLGYSGLAEQDAVYALQTNTRTIFPTSALTCGGFLPSYYVRPSKCRPLGAPDVCLKCVYRILLGQS